MITVEEFVAREVRACASELIDTLSEGAGGGSVYEELLPPLCDRAAELAAPIDMWEEAADEAGFSDPAA